MAYGINIEDTFSFHPATPTTGPRHDAVRERCKELAHWIDDNTPGCPEQTLALRKLQECMMFANAAVAIHGVPNA